MARTRSEITSPWSLCLEGDDTNIRALVRGSLLPVWLVDLEQMRILEVSDAVSTMLGAGRDQLLERDVTDFVVDQTMARARLRLLTSSILDSYRVRARAFRRLDGTEFEVDLCVRAVNDESPRRMAIAVLLPANEEQLVAQAPHRGDLVVLGTVDSDWRIDRISADVELLLGHPAAALIGRPVSSLVEPDEWPGLVVAIGHALHGHGGASTRLPLRQAEGTSRVCRMLVTPLAGTEEPGFAFSLTVADDMTPDVADRAWELESHLRRIAREIAASGLLADLTSTPTATSMPAMAGLSTRELEIVTGLLAGERVQMIANRMFLSPSTVRNHLTSVYRKLGVRSQQQLLTRLRSDPGTSTTKGDFA
jgi:PAS domain S-box-containing protein